MASLSLSCSRLLLPSSAAASPHRPRLLHSLSSPLRPHSSKLLSAVPSALNSASAPQTPGSAMRGAESDVMGLLLRDRIIFINGDIDDFVADAVISQLLLLDARNPKKDIRLFINSYGGPLSAVLAVYDVMQLVRADVSTIGLGIVASTSAIVLGGGTKGKRLAMPNTRIMIQQPLGSAKGDVLSVQIQANEMRYSKSTVIRVIAGFTGRAIEKVERDIDTNFFMSPIEGVEYGIIDGVIDRDSIIPTMPLPDGVESRFDPDFLGGDERFERFVRPEVPDEEIY